MNKKRLTPLQGDKAWAKEKTPTEVLKNVLAQAIALASPKGAMICCAIAFEAPLAFLSPRIIAAIVDGTAPADLTVTSLAKALPYSWAEQEERVGLSL
jgi:hypothetical protein